jgi:hypothetical protein
MSNRDYVISELIVPVTFGTPHEFQKQAMVSFIHHVVIHHGPSDINLIEKVAWHVYSRDANPIPKQMNALAGRKENYITAFFFNLVSTRLHMFVQLVLDPF